MFKDIDDVGNLTANSYHFKGSNLEIENNSFINYVTTYFTICIHN